MSPDIIEDCFRNEAIVKVKGSFTFASPESSLLWCSIGKSKMSAVWLRSSQLPPPYLWGLHSHKCLSASVSQVRVWMGVSGSELGGAGGGEM